MEEARRLEMKPVGGGQVVVGDRTAPLVDIPRVHSLPAILPEERKVFDSVAGMVVI